MIIELATTALLLTGGAGLLLALSDLRARRFGSAVFVAALALILLSGALVALPDLRGGWDAGRGLDASSVVGVAGVLLGCLLAVVGAAISRREDAAGDGRVLVPGDDGGPHDSRTLVR